MVTKEKEEQFLKGTPTSIKATIQTILKYYVIARQSATNELVKLFEELYKKYRDQGFVVLGFPCNQFAGQDPGSNEEILEFCQVNYGVTFPMFSKIDVNRKNAHPLFEYLKSELPGTLSKKIKWNFTKFLISKDGKPLKRYSPTVKPAEIEEDILKALK